MRRRASIHVCEPHLIQTVASFNGCLRPPEALSPCPHPPQIPGVPIMYIQSHRYNIERLPEATVGGAPRN